MRGASALQQVLERDSTARVRAFVVWEPILLTDLGPPGTSVLDEIRDRRVIQYWDPGLLVSREVVRLWRSRGGEQSVPAGTKAWDWVLVFPPGTRWEEILPAPSYEVGPVWVKTPQLRREILGASE